MKLLPCPFCGGQASVRETHGNHFIVCCDNEHCAAYLQPEFTPLAAITVWNTRAPLSQPLSIPFAWIPATQPPHNSRNVLIHDPRGKTATWIGYLSQDRRRKNRTWYLAEWYLSPAADMGRPHVTHWAELPPAPQPIITGCATFLYKASHIHLIDREMRPICGQTDGRKKRILQPCMGPATCKRCLKLASDLNVESCKLNVASSSISPVQRSTLNAQRSTFKAEEKGNP